MKDYIIRYGRLFKEKMVNENMLTIEAFEKLPTPRKLAYRKKIHHYEKRNG